MRLTFLSIAFVAMRPQWQQRKASNFTKRQKLKSHNASLRVFPLGDTAEHVPMFKTHRAPPLPPRKTNTIRGPQASSCFPHTQDAVRVPVETGRGSAPPSVEEHVGTRRSRCSLSPTQNPATVVAGTLATKRLSRARRPQSDLSQQLPEGLRAC